MSFFVGGVPFDSLPPSDIDPTGYAGSSPYWDFGATRVTNLRDASGLGGYVSLAGYAGSTPFTAPAGVYPAAPSGLSSSPNNYAVPSISDSPFDITPSDGDMTFELSGMFGSAMVRAAAPSPVATAAEPSNGVVEASIIQPSNKQWGVLLIIAVIVWAIFQQE